jgi:hypothetical protein
MNTEPAGPDWHRSQAIELFNSTWDHLDTHDRTPADDLAMLTAALASRHHWRVIGEPKNHAISDWQVARVLAALGDGALAHRFAQSSLSIVEEHDLDAFLLGSAHEALARADALLGDLGGHAQHVAAARRALDQVASQEERKVLAADIEDAGKLT